MSRDGSLWRAGPLRFDVGMAPPSDWPTVRGERADLIVDVTAARPSEGGAVPEGAICEVTTAREVRGTVRVARAGSFDARLDVAAGTATYRGVVDVGARHECPVFESFLRAASSILLLERGGALLHGASVARAGAAYVFCGVSGAGKTTLVDGAADDAYLSDDQSIVTPAAVHAGEPRFAAWGSPFSGLAARRSVVDAHVPVRAVVLLSAERPAATRLERCTRAAAAALLLRHVCCFEKTAAESARALAFVDALVRAVPVFTLARHLDTSRDPVLTSIDASLDERAAPLDARDRRAA